jgi:hypothetical protein
MKYTRHVPLMGKMKNVYKIIARKPEWKEPLARHRRR